MGPYCDISCTDNQGYFRDDHDGSVVTATITPVFRCVEELGNGLYTAWFGYTNTNPNNVYITSLAENAFYRGPSEDTEFSPPTQFLSQTVQFAVKAG